MVSIEPAVVPAIPASVLVVEDEMLLRMRAVDMVEDAGFTAIEAINADDALAILESRTDIELLFTDIQMPAAWMA
jgi:CheY-like chemotaxis protein